MAINGAAIRAQFACPVVTADLDYATPTLRWLLGPFWNHFRARRGALGKWTAKNDCDNFARAYAQDAQDSHALSKGSEAQALAVGEIFYVQDSGGGHAINAAFVDNPPRLVFIEPQTGQAVDLTPAERASIFFARF